MLNRLEEHPKEFIPNITTNKQNKWYYLFDEVVRNGTFIEQVVALKVKEKTFKKLRRQTLLGEIVAQSIAPEEITREQVVDGQAGMNHLAHIQLQKQYTAMQAQALNATGITSSMLGQGIGNPSQLLAAQQPAAAEDFQRAVQRSLYNQYSPTQP